MDQHPVPQDITGFQFKLVGDMTLKQFGYLAAGAIVAWVFYITDWNPLIKMPLCFLSFTFGVALAFIPIQERPLETWIINFIRSVYQPTQYVWKKSAVKLDFLDHLPVDLPPEEPLAASLVGSSAQKQKLQDYLATVSSSADSSSPPPPPSSSAPLVTVDDLLGERQTAGDHYQKKLDKIRREVKDEVSLAPTIDDLAKAAGVPLQEEKKPEIEYAILSKEEKIAEMEAVNRRLLKQIDELNARVTQLVQENEGHATTNSRYQKQIEEMKKILETLREDREKLKQELILIKMPPPPPVSRDSRVQFADKLPIDKTADGKLPPNTIHGLVDDTDGLAITGAVVLIKNAAGAPVRALRTNKLGQFLASTPLENGTYTIEVEKDGLLFDEVGVKLTGTTLSPLEIKAKNHS